VQHCAVQRAIMIGAGWSRDVSIEEKSKKSPWYSTAGTGEGGTQDLDVFTRVTRGRVGEADMFSMTTGCEGPMRARADPRRPLGRHRLLRHGQRMTR